MKYIYQQTIIQWRIPVAEDGKLGQPEIMKKFTSEWGGSQRQHKKGKDQPTIISADKQDVEYF